MEYKLFLNIKSAPFCLLSHISEMLKNHLNKCSEFYLSRPVNNAKNNDHLHNDTHRPCIVLTISFWVLVILFAMTVAVVDKIFTDWLKNISIYSSLRSDHISALEWYGLDGSMGKILILSKLTGKLNWLYIIYNTKIKKIYN